jgi:ribosomal protein S18 acetylase RimI-like enzyme
MQTAAPSSSTIHARRDALAVRMEDAALNATVVREQMLYDGWLLRWADAKAKRARSVNLIGPSMGDLEEKLAFCRDFYRRQGQPLIFRMTSVAPDPLLDQALTQRGYTVFSTTAVMSAPIAAVAATDASAPLRLEYADTALFASVTGDLRAYAPEHVREHQQRLAAIAVPCARIIARDGAGRPVGAGMAVVDGELLGIFDVVVDESQRRRGYARALVNHLIALGRQDGAHTAYLQVEFTNVAARTLYHSLGFGDRYEYWYRAPQNN